MQTSRQKPPYIYFVTTVFIDNNIPAKKFGQVKRSRCWGFYYSLKDAIRGMKMSCSDEAGHYNYCVIERYSPGIYAVCNFEKWYFWQKDYIRNCKEKDFWGEASKPENCKQIINFAIG